MLGQVVPGRDIPQRVELRGVGCSGRWCQVAPSCSGSSCAARAARAGSARRRHPAAGRARAGGARWRHPAAGRAARRGLLGQEVPGGDILQRVKLGQVVPGGDILQRVELRGAGSQEKSFTAASRGDPLAEAGVRVGPPKFAASMLGRRAGPRRMADAARRRPSPCCGYAEAPRARCLPANHAGEPCAG